MYFKYMYDLLHEKGAGHIKIFAGGGGVILPEEIQELMQFGITRIYSPDDGRAMGLQGMINDLVEKSDFSAGEEGIQDIGALITDNAVAIARIISGRAAPSSVTASA
jgi:methylmalonyl-CoA mutase